MCSEKECAKYFKSQQGYHRCFEEFRKKWRSYGKAAGRITLRNTSEDERRALGGIIGKVFYEETIQFSFLEFEQGLQKTRFAPVNMKEVLEEYFGETLITTQEREEEQQERRKQFLGRICEYFAERAGREAAALFWVREMISGKKYGYQLLMREYAKDEKKAELLVRNVGNGLLKLEELTDSEDVYPLAVLAAEITDNPHYFDRGTTAGLLFVHAICCFKKMELPKSAHQWRKLLMQVCIVPDNISSMVHVYGLRLLTEAGWHLAYDTFCQRREPYVITMENMKGIVGAQAVGKKAYVVENEMVFSYLIHNLKDFDYTLLCTSGQPRSVVQVLIPYILGSGAEIYYNGDIDPDGIRIADRLWKKFGSQIHIWRMTPADYEKSLSKEKIGDIGRTKLENIGHPILKKTAECMKEKGVAGYQENMLKELLEDMEADKRLSREHGISGLPLTERFEFRNICEEEAAQAVEIERICFPPNEACSEINMKKRVKQAAELFLVAVDRKTGRLAGFLNGVATDEASFRDEFFTDISLHNPKGKNIMLLGLDVLPEYRGQGLAREIMCQYLRRERGNGRRTVTLTCLQSKVEMYQKMGFRDEGMADSAWGGEEWHAMSCFL